MPNYKQYAYQYSKLGLSVVPLLPGQKYPGLKEWQLKATRDPHQIYTWWTESPDSNIGFITGKRSDRIVVLDLDEHPEEGKFGIELWREWEHEHGKFPETWEAVTGSGGRHLYFRDTEDRPRAQHLYNGSVDFQSDSALIVLPPSVHPNGNSYYWDVSPDDVPLADINDNVLQFIKEGQKQSVRKTFTEDKDSKIQKGSRVNFCFNLVARLINIGLPEDSIRKTVQEENLRRCDPPLTNADLEREVFPAIKRYKSPASYNTRFRLPDVLTGDSRKDMLYRAVYSMLSRNHDNLSIFMTIHQENRVKCKPPLPEDDLDQLIDQAIRNYAEGGRFNGSGDHIRPDDISPFFRSK